MTSAFQLIIVWTLGAAKASVLFFYKRVFCQYREMNSALRIAIIMTLVINTCWVIGFFFLGLFQCGNHFSYGGNHFKYCTLINQYQKGFYISDIILDVWIMAMPIPYVCEIQLRPTFCLRGLTRAHEDRTPKHQPLEEIVMHCCFPAKFRVRLQLLIPSIRNKLTQLSGLGASIARLVNYLQTTHGMDILGSLDPRYYVLADKLPVNPGAIHPGSGGGHTRVRCKYWPSSPS